MNKLTIKEIKTILSHSVVEDEMIQILSNDERKGVQRELHAFYKRKDKQREEAEKFEQMLFFENSFRQQGMEMIAGVDEAGRGPLAGPVVSAAVILPKHFKLLGLNDSKQVKKDKREMYFDYIIKEAIDYHISIIGNEIIDQINIFEATKKSMIESIQNLNVVLDMTLIDAVQLDMIQPTKSIIKGDAKSISIAAASILAKVTRDRYMEKIHEAFPEYGFKEHAGYGTKKHLEAIHTYGICSYHRKSFAPIREMI